MSNVKTRKLVSISGEAIKEALKCLMILPKILAKCSNTMSDIVLASEEEAKTASRQYSNEKGTTVASQIYGHPLDKKYHTQGALEH